MKLIFSGASKKSAMVSAIILLLFSGCVKSHNQSGKNENSDFQNAVWITDSRDWPVADSLMYGDFPAPLFRKEFTVKKDVKSATLFITAAGYYQAYINGKTNREKYLDPAWTNYSKRIYYSEYDLTADLQTGMNCIGATLGNGFYNPLPMKMWSTYNLRELSACR